MALDVATLRVVLTGNASPYLTSLGAAGKGTDAFERKTVSSFDRVGRAAKTLGKVGLFAIAAGFGYAVKEAAGFEKQMSALGAVADANTKQMKRFRDQAIKAGAATKYSASEAAKAQTELAKGGLGAEQILKGGLNSALNLAAAGELDLAEAAATTVNAMKLFGIEGRKSGKVADALAVAANKTTADVGDFALALRQGGGAAKLSGVSFNETVVALEALAEAGVRGSDAGTSLKAFLLNIATPSEKAKKAMRELGFSLYDAEERMKSLPAISENLRSAFGDLTEEQFTQKAGIIAGSDAIRTLYALYDAGPDKLRKLAKANQEQGFAAEVARKKQDNFAGALERLRGSVDTLAIVVGSGLLPALADGASAVANFVAEMTAGKGAGGAFAAVIVSAWNGIKTGVTDAVDAIGSVIDYYEADIRASWDAISAAVGSAVGAIRGFLSEHENDIRGAGETIKRLPQTIYTAFGTAGEAIGSAFDVVRQKVGEAIEWLRKNLDLGGDDMRQFGEAVVNVGKVVGGAVLAIGLVWKKIFEGVILPVVKRVLPAVKTIVEGVLRTIGGFVKTWSGLLTLDFGKMWEGIKQVFSGQLKTLVGVIRGATAPIREAASAIGRAIKTVIGGAFNFLSDKIIKPWLRFTLGAIDKFLGGIEAMLRVSGKLPIVGGKFDDLADAVSDARDRLQGLKGSLDGVPSKADKINPVIAKFRDLGGIVRGVARSLDTAADAIGRLRPPSGGFGGFGGGSVGPGFPIGGLPNLNAVNRMSLSMGLSGGQGLGQGYRPGDDGYHGIGRATDHSGAAGAMMRFAQTVAALAGSRLKELIHTPLGWGIKNGARVPLSFWGSAVNADHYDHVHVAMARGGKVTRPSFFAGEEAPAHPEYVISTNPRDRGRMQPLVAEAAMRVGLFAQGGRTDKGPIRSLWEAMQGMVGKRRPLNIGFIPTDGTSPWEAEAFAGKHESTIAVSRYARDALTGKGRKRNRAAELIVHELAHALQDPGLYGRSKRAAEGGAAAWVNLFGDQALRAAGLGGHTLNTMYPKDAKWVLSHKGKAWVRSGQFGLGKVTALRRGGKTAEDRTAVRKPPTETRHYNPFSKRYEMMTTAQYKKLQERWTKKFPKKPMPARPPAKAPPGGRIIGSLAPFETAARGEFKLFTGGEQAGWDRLMLDWAKAEGTETLADDKTVVGRIVSFLERVQKSKRQKKAPLSIMTELQGMLNDWRGRSKSVDETIKQAYEETTTIPGLTEGGGFTGLNVGTGLESYLSPSTLAELEQLEGAVLYAATTDEGGFDDYAAAKALRDKKVSIYEALKSKGAPQSVLNEALSGIGLPPEAPGAGADDAAIKDRADYRETLRAKAAALQGVYGSVIGASRDLGLTVNFNSLAPATPNEAREVASHIVGGMGFMGSQTSPRLASG